MVTVISAILQKTGILICLESRICFIGELVALLICGVFIFVREVNNESCPSIAAEAKTFCSVMLDLFFCPCCLWPGKHLSYLKYGEYRTNFYAVHLQSWNPGMKSDLFHILVPVFLKVSPRWDGNNHFEIGSIRLKKTGTVLYCSTKKAVEDIYV